MLRHNTGHTPLAKGAAGINGRNRQLHVTHFQRPSTLPAKQQLQQTTVNIPTPETLPTAAGQPGISPDAAAKMQATLTLVHKKHSTPEADADALSGFLLKCKLAWNIFFPPTAAAAPPLSPSELGRQRLSMILVADRCGLSPSSLVEMQRDSVRALQDVMDLEELQDAQLRFTMVREGGTTYSLAVPVLHNGLLEGPGGPEAAPQAAAGPLVSSEEEELEELHLVDVSTEDCIAQGPDLVKEQQRGEELGAPADVQQQALASEVETPPAKKPAFVDVVEEEEPVPAAVVSSSPGAAGVAQDSSSSRSCEVPAPTAVAAAAMAASHEAGAADVEQVVVPMMSASSAAAAPAAAAAQPAVGPQQAGQQGQAADPQLSYTYERFVADVKAAEGVDHELLVGGSSKADTAAVLTSVGQVAVAGSPHSTPSGHSPPTPSTSTSTSPRSSKGKKRGRKSKKRGGPKPQSS